MSEQFKSFQSGNGICYPSIDYLAKGGKSNILDTAYKTSGGAYLSKLENSLKSLYGTSNKSLKGGVTGMPSEYYEPKKMFGGGCEVGCDSQAGSAKVNQLSDVLTGHINSINQAAAFHNKPANNESFINNSEIDPYDHSKNYALFNGGAKKPASKKPASKKPASKKHSTKKKSATKKAPAKKKASTKKAPAKKKASTKKAPTKKKASTKKAPTKKKAAYKKK